MRKKAKYNFLFDVVAVAVSIAIAIVLVRSGALHNVISFTGSYTYLGVFIAGLFFTSVFTIPVSIAAIIEFAEVLPPIPMALVAACGSVLGDLGILMVVRDRLMPDFTTLVAHTRFKRFVYITRKKWFRTMSPFLGALVIASPLPDELGIALMGFSKLKVNVLLPVLFLMNFLGVLIIAVAVQN